MTVAEKKWTKDQIKYMLLNNNKWLCRGILALYDLQTALEKNRQHTNEINGVGFNQPDAPFLSEVARLLIAGKTLTQGQLNYARKKMIKYSGQLCRIANKDI
jgi:hypothetical protein